MSLTVYDPEKNCQVLNPELFERPMNAFHPDYVKTFMPEFLSNIRSESTQQATGAKVGAKSKATREAVNKGAFTISKFPKTKAKAKVDLAPKDFHVFNKAGMPKGGK